MLANITSYLGGRAVEELMFDDVSNSAYDDFKTATQIAIQMVTNLGMSDLLPVQDTDKKHVDIEIKKIIDECMNIAKKIMKENQVLLDKIANTLLEQENIVKEQLEQIVNQNN